MQKITLILTLIQLCVGTNLVAQSKYYEKSIRWEYLHNGWNIFEESNNTYLITGSNKDTFSQWNAYSCLINSQGEIDTVFQHNLPTGFGSTCNNGIKIEYGYVLSGLISHNENPISAQCYVIQIAPDGSLIDTVWVGKQYSQSRCITRTPDGGYLLGGYSRDPTSTIYYPYLLRLNADMEVVWDSTYSVPNNMGGLGMFRKLITDLTDNTYYALALLGNDPINLVWMRLNEQGEIINQRVFLGEPYDVINDIASISVSGTDIIRCKDGDFLIALSRRQFDHAISAHLVKMSPDGDTIRWNKLVYNLGYIAKVEELADNSFMIGGGFITQPPDDISYQNTVAHVSTSGDVLWKRVYGGTENDYIYDFIPTTDGSYFFTGRTESNLPNGGANVYLLKTNCMGLLTQPQATFTATMDSAALTASFQNLSQFVYPDSIDGGHFIWDFGDGNTSTQANPTHTYTQGGNYTVTLTAIVCSDTSVFVQEVSTWAVGVNNITIPSVVQPFVPNPTTGTTQLAYSLPIDAQAVLTLTDISGKVQQRVLLIGNGIYDLDTRPLSDGLYLYTVQQNGNVLLRHKLVVIK